MHYLYILQSEKDKDFYTGKNFSTAPRRPFKLIYYEAYLLKQDAEERERYLKTSMGRRVIRKQLKNYLKGENSEVDN